MFVDTYLFIMVFSLAVISALLTLFAFFQVARFTVRLFGRIAYFRRNPPRLNTFWNVTKLVVIHAWSDIWL